MRTLIVASLDEEGRVRRQLVEQAKALLEDDVQAGRQALTDMTAEDFWLSFVRFGRRRFDVPDIPDADGLLFQYGTYSFDGPRTFALDLTRQFDVSDSGGDHDHYVQVHCELRYGLTSALEALGSFHSWFFHESGADLDEWARGLTERPAWTTIGGLAPVEIMVYQEQV